MLGVTLFAYNLVLCKISCKTLTKPLFLLYLLNYKLDTCQENCAVVKRKKKLETYVINDIFEAQMAKVFRIEQGFLTF